MTDLTKSRALEGIAKECVQVIAVQTDAYNWRDS